MQKSIIKLDEKLFIGSGTLRFVYIHPEDDSKCLKIQQHDKVKENKIDVKYHQHLIARNAPYEHIAKFYGEVMTDKGKAVMFDVVRDYDHQISKTLYYYLSKNNKEICGLIENHLLALKKHLLDNRIIFVDVYTGNIVLCKTSKSESKLVIIDALGSRNTIPLSHYFNWIAQSMIKRRWARSINRGYSKLESANYLQKLLADAKI